MSLDDNMDFCLFMVLVNTASITPRPTINESRAMTVTAQAWGHLPSWNGSTEAVIAKDPHKANDPEVSSPRSILMLIGRPAVNKPWQ